MIFQEGKIPGTVTVLTRNSAKTLEKTLEGVRDFDDILVCDGGSTDDTLSIAARHGARVISQDKQYLDEKGKIYDYAGLHNQMLDAAKHIWIFSIDSDELAGRDLVEAMQKVIKERGAEGSGAFWVNRKYVLNGKIIDCASTYPNRQMRFFSKNSTHGYVKRIHERIKLKEGIHPEILDGFMYLPTEDDLLAIRKKWNYQTAVAVEQVGELTFPRFLHVVFDNAKISTLWILRLFRNYLFCSGTKMPLKFEMERHLFHLRMIRAMWRVTKLKI